MTVRHLVNAPLVGAVAWLITIVLAVFVVLRLFGVMDTHARLFAIETLTIWLLAPAYPAFVLGLLSHRRALSVAAGVLVLLHLYWTAPDLRWWPHEQPHIEAEPFRLVSANVLFHNRTPAKAAKVLAAANPDVLVVVELTPRFQALLEAQPAVIQLPYRVTTPSPHGAATGAGIYSRFPIDTSHGALPDAPFPGTIVHLPSGDVGLVAVHTQQPLGGLPHLRRQLGRLARFADRTEIPLVLAGDFNASRQHAPFRALLSHGLRDAHDERGRSFARTWPMDLGVPAFALIDHVLVSEEIAVDDVDELTVPGSDHRAVISRLAR